MDALYTTFQSTLSPEPNTRIQAELDLKNAETQAGLLPTAIQIIASEQADSSVRQAAAMWVYLQGIGGTNAASIQGNEGLHNRN